MHTVVFRVIAAFLLLAQVWAGCARGVVVCIPVGPCEQHQASHGCGIDHDHGATAEHDHEGCGCHIHVPGSDEPMAPGARVDVLAGGAPGASAALVDVALPGAVLRSGPARPPDRASSSRLAHLRTTRLVI